MLGLFRQENLTTERKVKSPERDQEAGGAFVGSPSPWGVGLSFEEFNTFLFVLGHLGSYGADSYTRTRIYFYSHYTWSFSPRGAQCSGLWSEAGLGLNLALLLVS